MGERLAGSGTENLRLVLRHRGAAPERDLVPLLTAVLGRCRSLQGSLAEARGWLAAALRSSDALGWTLPRARALYAAGFAALLDDRTAEARPWIEESVAIFQERGDP
jgi:hypothetical protein